MRTACIVLLLTLASASPVLAQCPLRHLGLEGGFDFTGTEYDGSRGGCAHPPLRYVLQGPADVCSDDLLNGNLDLGIAAIDPARWFLVNADHCAVKSVESSFVDRSREGTVDHRGFYLLAFGGPGCDAFGNLSILDFDAVDDAYGANRNLVPVQPIPAPRTSPFGSPLGGEYYAFRVDLPPAPVYSSPGPSPRPAVAGYRVLYRQAVPTSSDPSHYQGEVRDPLNLSRPFGLIAPGQSVTVAAPAGPPFEKIFVAAVLVYDAGPPELGSNATSAHAAVGLSDFGCGSGTVEIAKTMTPTVAVPGDTVTITLAVSGRRDGCSSSRDPYRLEAWDNLAQELPEGCLDLASGRNLTCAACTSMSYDPLTGKLRAAVTAPADFGAFLLSIDFTAGPGAGVDCVNSAFAIGSQSGLGSSRAAFRNYGDQIAILRASVGSIDPPLDLAPLFPLAVYRDPAPAFPFTDEANLLSDGTRPLVLYGYTRGENLYLVKDLASDSVTLSR